MTFSSTGHSYYNNAFFLFIFHQRLKILAVAYGMYKHNLLQKRQVVNMCVILHKYTNLEGRGDQWQMSMWTRDEEGKFSGSTGLGLGLPLGLELLTELLG